MQEAHQFIVVEQQVVVQWGVRALLTAAGMRSLGAADTARGARELAARCRPDVAIVELTLETRTAGVDLVREWSWSMPHLRVLIYTAADDAASRRAASGCGAYGYLSKAAPARELVRAVDLIARGQYLLGTAEDRLPNVSPRELQVLGLLADGLSADDIARELVLAPDTARTHIRNLLRRLNASSRAQAVAIGTRTGLI